MSKHFLQKAPVAVTPPVEGQKFSGVIRKQTGC